MAGVQKATSESLVKSNGCDPGNAAMDESMLNPITPSSCTGFKRLQDSNGYTAQMHAIEACAVNVARQIYSMADYGMDGIDPFTDIIANNGATAAKLLENAFIDIKGDPTFSRYVSLTNDESNILNSCLMGFQDYSRSSNTAAAQQGMQFRLWQKDVKNAMVSPLL
jgi:hypothetical protein